MMWFFAILIVLAMGAVGLVAAGRGRPMTPAYDDRPDALVPEDGPILGGDLRRVRFSLAVRGYRMSEVDALLQRLAAQLEETDAQRIFGPEGSAAAQPTTQESTVEKTVQETVQEPRDARQSDAVTDPARQPSADTAGHDAWTPPGWSPPGRDEERGSG